MMITEIEMPEFVCLFCEYAVPDGKMCVWCKDYKSVMHINAWEHYTGREWKPYTPDLGV